MGKQWKQWQTVFSWAPKSLQMVTVAMKLRHLLLGRRIMTNLDSLLKSRDIISWLTEVHLVKAMVFPVWMWELDYKKAEHWRIDAFDLWCWRRLERVPWTARRSNQSILKEISPEYSLEGLMLKLKLQSFDHLWKTDSFVKTLMLEKIGGRRRRGQQRMRWLDGITDSMDMSLNRLRSWWRTRRPSVLQSMGPQRVGHNWLTELNWKFVQVFIQSYRKIWMNFLANPLFQM